MILCLLVALAAGFGISHWRSVMRFTVFTNGQSAPYSQYDKRILSLAADTSSINAVKAVVWRESRFDRQKYELPVSALDAGQRESRNEGARDTISTTSSRTNSSILKRISKPVRGICAVRSTMANESEPLAVCAAEYMPEQPGPAVG